MDSADTKRFTRQHRLLTAAAFSRVFDKAFRSRDKCFTVLCRDNDSDLARLGLAIAKKHCRKASGRNRIKRVVRESFRLHQAELAGLDVVVLNQPKASTADSALLFDSLAAHWRRCSRSARRLPAPEGKGQPRNGKSANGNAR